MTYFITFVRILFDLLTFAIIARVLMSWMQGMNHHPLVLFLKDITEPVMSLARKITPKVGMIDFSPVIALIGLDILKAILVSLLSGYL